MHTLFIFTHPHSVHSFRSATHHQWQSVAFRPSRCLRIHTPELTTVLLMANSTILATIVSWVILLIAAYLIVGILLVRLHRSAAVTLPPYVRALRMPVHLYLLYIWPTSSDVGGAARQQPQQPQPQPQQEAPAAANAPPAADEVQPAPGAAVAAFPVNMGDGDGGGGGGDSGDAGHDGGGGGGGGESKT